MKKQLFLDWNQSAGGYTNCHNSDWYLCKVEVHRFLRLPSLPVKRLQLTISDQPFERAIPFYLTNSGHLAIGDKQFDLIDETHEALSRYVDGGGYFTLKVIR
jgi:hypothetical protein